MALLGNALACGCEDGSVALFRLHKEAGVFMLYSLLRLQHVPQLGRPSQVRILYALHTRCRAHTYTAGVSVLLFWTPHGGDLFSDSRDREALAGIDGVSYIQNSAQITIRPMCDCIYLFIFVGSTRRRASSCSTLLATETGETFTGEERCLPFLPFHY